MGIDAPQFSECTECRFYDARRRAAICRKCGIGEYFEALLEELLPERDTTFRNSRKSHDHDDDK
jgi:hypothetical protein